MEIEIETEINKEIKYCTKRVSQTEIQVSQLDAFSLQIKDMNSRDEE